MVSILKWIYIVFFLLVLFYALKKKRNVSFILIYFFSSMLYYFNAFEGEIFVGKLNQIGVESYSINNGTYAILLINMLIAFFFIIVENEKDDYLPKTTLSNEMPVMKAFLLVVLVFSLYMCIKHNVFFRSNYKKSELAEESGRGEVYYKYLASFAFVYSFSAKNTHITIPWKIIGTLPILSTFLFGNRSYLVISLVAVMFDMIYMHCGQFGRNLYSYLAKHKKIVIASGILVFVTLTVKGITGALFVKNFDIVIQRLSSIDYYKQVFFVSEPNTIMTNLNTIVANNYQVEKSTYSALWAYLIPLATAYIEQAMGVVNFTKTYQIDLYVTNTNRASTYLGEAFANGGYLVVPIVVFLYLVLILLLMKGYKRCTTNISRSAILLMGIDAAFYVQRNSMAFEFSRLRAYIYIAVILMVAIGVVSQDHRVRF